MKAVVKVAAGPDQVRFVDWDDAVPGPGEALLKVRAVGICGTDVHILKDHFGGSPPFVLGHEFVGEIAGLGEGAAGWEIGQRVVAENISGSCRTCSLCRTGRMHLCESKRAYGSSSNGVMAELAVMPALALHAVPDCVSDEDAAVTEPLAIACHAVLTRGQVGFGEKVLIIGPGPIGLLAAGVAKLAGAHVAIVGTPQDSSRLNLARTMGADLVVSTGDANWKGTLADWRPEQPLGCAIELSGSAAAVAEAIALVGRGHRIVAVGITGKSIPVPWDAAIVKGIDIRFCFSSTFHDWEWALDVMSQRRFVPSSIVTHRFPLSQWARAFEMIDKKEAIKCLLIP